MKTQIRKKILDEMNLITPQLRAQMSKKIFENLLSLDEYKKCWALMTYVSFDNEPDTICIIKDALSKAKTVCIPYVDWNNLSMYPVQIFSEDDIDFSTRIPQPFSETRVDPEEIDLIIVPGIAFDLKCNRIGRGKGFYDRFLSGSHRAIKIGLAYDFQILDSIPVSTNDVKMDIIVSETRILKVC